jgi:hypothetical protein
MQSGSVGTMQGCLHFHMQSRRELTTPEPQHPEGSPRDLRATRSGTGRITFTFPAMAIVGGICSFTATTTAAHCCFPALCYAVAAQCATTAVCAARLHLSELPSELSTPPLCQQRQPSQQPPIWRWTICFCRGGSTIWNCAAVKS